MTTFAAQQETPPPLTEHDILNMVMMGTQRDDGGDNEVKDNATVEEKRKETLEAIGLHYGNDSVAASTYVDGREKEYIQGDSDGNGGREGFEVFQWMMQEQKKQQKSFDKNEAHDDGGDDGDGDDGDGQQGNEESSSQWLAQFGRVQITPLPDKQQRQQQSKTGKDGEQDRPIIRYTREQLLALKDHPLSNRKLNLENIHSTLPLRDHSSGGGGGSSSSKNDNVNNNNRSKNTEGAKTSSTKSRDRSNGAILRTPDSTTRSKRGNALKKSPTTKDRTKSKTAAKATSWINEKVSPLDGGDDDDTEEELEKKKKFDEFIRRMKSSTPSKPKSSDIREHQQVQHQQQQQEQHQIQQKKDTRVVNNASSSIFFGLENPTERIDELIVEDTTETLSEDFSYLDSLMANSRLPQTLSGDNNTMEMGRFSKWFGDSSESDTLPDESRFIPTHDTNSSGFLSMTASRDVKNNQDNVEPYSSLKRHEQHVKESKVTRGIEQLKHLSSTSLNMNTESHDAASIEAQIMQSYGVDDKANGPSAHPNQHSSSGFNVNAFFGQHPQYPPTMPFRQPDQQHRIPAQQQQLVQPPFHHQQQHHQQQHQHKSQHRGPPAGHQRNPSSSDATVLRRQLNPMIPTQTLLREGKMVNRKTGPSPKKGKSPGQTVTPSNVTHQVLSGPQQFADPRNQPSPYHQQQSLPHPQVSQMSQTTVYHGSNPYPPQAQYFYAHSPHQAQNMWQPTLPPAQQQSQYPQQQSQYIFNPQMGMQMQHPPPRYTK